jgi:hypothetical protein
MPAAPLHPKRGVAQQVTFARFLQDFLERLAEAFNRTDLESAAAAEPDEIIEKPVTVLFQRRHGVHDGSAAACRIQDQLGGQKTGGIGPVAENDDERPAGR